ncbi:WD40-like Beta Propeller Repeat [Paenibacillus sp. UNC496MF]|uniref:TolB family protein n=1 Tax=Paenibacillus sp. UNC496MF TaxID=1502753 RepID=UPI0008EE32D5|nr:PD40 domain-containing protein [Paenibacillus sp. UNC496MF]SFJ12824.1 WD40-like Beta Propeller Repeat [Paenibacillus sp. UNC496MF]
MDGFTFRGARRFCSRVAIVAAGVCLLAIPLAAGAAEPSRSSGSESVLLPGPAGAAQKAAFVRGGALWVEEQGRERRLTADGSFARNPGWSPDGRWIAYNAGEDERQLWIAEAASGNAHLAAPEGGSRFQWSPAKDRLAYLRDEKLYAVGAEEGDEPAEIAAGIGNFGWLPDGSGFLVSTAAQLQPDGWTPVTIARILLPSGTADPVQEEPLYVLPKQINDLIVVGTTAFKWSASGRWIAFLATPTASLSADGNTLCVLSSDGKTFLPVDQMAHNEQWYRWSPVSGPQSGDRLAYIAGIGREASSNKRLTVTSVPALRPATYTPAGYVDQSFAWYGAESIVASRAKEGAWTGEPGKRPMPFLARVDLTDGSGTAITKPPSGRGDFGPVALPPSELGWVRSDRTHSDVLLANSAAEAKKAKAWIKGIDAVDDFYEQWNWLPVLRVYGQAD